MSEFFKDDQNLTSPKDKRNLKSLKNSRVYIFQIARGIILIYLLILGVTIARNVLLWIHRRILKCQIYLKTKCKIIFISLKIHLHVPVRAAESESLKLGRFFKLVR
jgi:hypothetical protein